MSFTNTGFCKICSYSLGTLMSSVESFGELSGFACLLSSVRSIQLSFGQTGESFAVVFDVEVCGCWTVETFVDMFESHFSRHNFGLQYGGKRK